MDDDRKTLYVETTIPSYATARENSDPLTASRQAMTKLFWERERNKYRLFVSDAVVMECERGDKNAAQRRLDFIAGIENFRRPAKWKPPPMTTKLCCKYRGKPK
jgi:hypothetical protein